MTDEGREDSLTELGVAASLAHRYAESQRDFTDYLAAVLESALPADSEIARSGGLFRERRITAIRVRLGGFLYSLHVPERGPLQPSRTKIVRGIKLSTDALPMADWLRDLGEAMAAYARTNLEASEALQRLLEA